MFDDVLRFLDLFTLRSYLFNEFALLRLFLFLLLLVPLCLMLRIFQVLLDLLQLILSVLHRALFLAEVGLRFWRLNFRLLWYGLLVFDLNFVLFGLLLIDNGSPGLLFHWLLLLRCSGRG